MSRSTKSTSPPSQDNAVLRAHLAKYRADNTQAFKQLAIAFSQWLGTMLLYTYGYIPLLVFIASESLSLLHLFMIFHDLGHGSFFSNSKWNHWGEFLIQFFIITPVDWSKKHKLHHSTSGDLTKGPTGWNDTIYFTVEEYNALSPLLKKLYRALREPLVFFTCAPALNWFVKYRIPFLELLDPAQKTNGVTVVTNSLVNTAGGSIVFWFVYKIMGEKFWAYMLTVYICTVLGIGLFHLQHAFNPSYTTRTDWNLLDSAIKGSSVLTIPSWLKTWTMGIEYHHIHHYSSIIPGYLLKKCHEEAPAGLWEGTTVLTPSEMFEALFYTLYDEKTGRYLSFNQLEAASLKK
eukprot:TRINITY_DN14325_c0_g1_i1.p1 TRINITY_DN14325_c0_g1~~TRINITY_DN14325_c0_g1_i1.p1  ORF type:complete len:347 (-),score=54.99 TRINITY_DN14325_c0_g1_i1:411-1451(-)